MIFYGHAGAINGDFLRKDHSLEMRIMTAIYNWFIPKGVSKILLDFLRPYIQFAWGELL